MSGKWLIAGVLLAMVSSSRAEREPIEAGDFHEPLGIAHRDNVLEFPSGENGMVMVPITLESRHLTTELERPGQEPKESTVYEFRVSYTDPVSAEEVNCTIRHLSPFTMGMVQDASGFKFFYCLMSWGVRIYGWEKLGLFDEEGQVERGGQLLLLETNYLVSIPNEDRSSFAGPWDNVINAKIRKLAITKKGTALIDLWADPDLAFDREEHSIIYEISRDQMEPVSRYTTSFEEALKKVNSEERQ